MRFRRYASCTSYRCLRTGDPIFCAQIEHMLAAGDIVGRCWHRRQVVVMRFLSFSDAVRRWHRRRTRTDCRAIPPKKVPNGLQTLARSERLNCRPLARSVWSLGVAVSAVGDQRAAASPNRALAFPCWGPATAVVESAHRLGLPRPTPYSGACPTLPVSSVVILRSTFAIADLRPAHSMSLTSPHL